MLAPMRRPSVLAQFDLEIADLPLRAKSLIATMFGDSIAPHGGTAWLGGLIALAAPFGVNERSVRTTVFRLTAEGWLVGGQVGRRSHYSLTESGRRRFEAAFRRIYAAALPAWQGEWCLVVEGPDLPRDRRKALETELGWLGFGRFGSGLLAHPGIDDATVSAALQGLGVTQQVLTLRAGAGAVPFAEPLPALVRQAWDLDRLEADYGAFLARFRPVLAAMQGRADADPERSFVVRTLLIHEYRRVMLRDPQLPVALLPASWPGAAARTLTRNLYALTQQAAETHLRATLDTPDGPLPAAAPYFYERFGGIGAAA
jgi:phenylacetic acid degradation operon negative regulatory protein